MALVVNSNIASLNAQRNLNRSQNSLNVSLQRLSSGLRINSAKDDAAGLYVSEQFTRDIRGSNQAARNAADGISLGQTAEGALGVIGNNLQRLREIAVQASNDTIGTNAAKGLQKEVTQLTAEIKRVVGSTNFNGTSLLSGSASLNFQIGAGSGDKISVSLSAANLSGLHSVSGISVTSTAAAVSALSALTADIDTVSSTRATFGAVQNRFESVISNLQNYSENLTASRSRIQDADFAAETANLTRSQILQQAGVSVLGQANAAPQAALSLLQ